MEKEPTTNINVSGVPVSLVNRIKGLDRIFSRGAVMALEAGIKQIEKPKEKKPVPAGKA